MDEHRGAPDQRGEVVGDGEVGAHTPGERWELEEDAHAVRPEPGAADVDVGRQLGTRLIARRSSAPPR